MTIWTQHRRALALAAVARWHGTPHRDSMAEPGVGVDCIRLVVAILTESGVTEPFTFPAYNVAEGLHDKSGRMRDGFLRCSHSRTVDKRDPQFGDVAVFKTGRMSGHCAFLLDGQLCHALARQFVMLSEYRLWRREVDCLIRLEAVGLRAQPALLWRATQV